MLQTGKDVVDALAGTTVVLTGWTTGVLPFLSVTLPSIWFIIRIWESDTIRELTNRVKEDK
jgi:hypothetical protein